MTYLVVILGEVVPKSITLQRTDRVALGRCRADGLLHDAGGAVPGVHDRLDAGGAARRSAYRLVREGGVHSPEELKLIVSANRRLGVLAPLQEEVIHRALDLENISVREIMVPRPDIFSAARQHYAGRGVAARG